LSSNIAQAEQLAFLDRLVAISTWASPIGGWHSPRWRWGTVAPQTAYA
jgi:hypothetical protein